MRKERRAGFAHGDIPPPRPHPDYDDGVIPTELYPQKCHPCARSKVSPMCPVAQTSLVQIHDGAASSAPAALVRRELCNVMTGSWWDEVNGLLAGWG